MAAPRTSSFHRFLYRPRQVWIRRCNFQIHLWVGIIVALYMIVISVTGSVLVLREELETLSGLKPWHNLKTPGPFADVATTIRNLSAAYPRFQIISVRAPGRNNPTFVAVVQGRSRLRVALHPLTGQVLGEFPERFNWMTAVEHLHVSLFLPRSGRIANGIGAAFLLLLCFTGLVNWWPGARNWRRALQVDFQRNWRRINFDLHSATGFWSLAVLSFWALSGIYFAWPRQVFALVNRLSPIVNAKPPIVTVTPQNSVDEPDLRRLLEQASAIDPATEFSGVVFPFGRRAPLEILMRRDKGLSREYEDTLYFDPYTGRYLTMWRYGVNKSMGDWFIWSQVPVHFGVYWGLGFKIVWAIVGLAIPVLAVTGFLMYWNRVLRKWLRKRPATPVPVCS